MSKDIEKLKKALAKHRKHASEFHEALSDVHRLSEAIYGFDYSDHDLDWLIDMLEYGGGISFEHFDDYMKNNSPNKD